MSPEIGLVESFEDRSEIDQPPLGGEIENSEEPGDAESAAARELPRSLVVHEEQAGRKIFRQQDGLAFAVLETVELWVESGRYGSIGMKLDPSRQVRRKDSKVRRRIWSCQLSKDGLWNRDFAEKLWNEIDEIEEDQIADRRGIRDGFHFPSSPSRALRSSSRSAGV